MSAYSIIIFRRFVKKKAEYFKINITKKSSPVDDDEECEENLVEIKSICLPTTVQSIHFSEDSPMYRLIMFNSKLAKMTIYLTLCSTLSHVSIITAGLFFLKNQENNDVINWCSIAIITTILLKNISNFFLFYRFNRNFRRHLRKSFEVFINETTNS